MLQIATILILLPVSASAFEFIQGGFVCYPGARAGVGEFSACQEISAREGRGAVRLDGWYKSAGTLLLGSPKACVASLDSQFLFHGTGLHGVGGPWVGFVGDDPASRAMMQRSAWGRRIHAYVKAQGWLDTPAFNTLTGAQVVAMGVPTCR